MKTKKLLILLVVLFMPFMVNAKTCDTSKITIDSINLDNKSSNVTEVTPATASGKNVNLDLAMSKKGDNIQYKIVIKNDSDEDFEIDSNSLGLNSNYVTYTIDAGDDHVVKANSTKTVLLRVEYKNTVPAEAYKSGIYNDSKDLVVNLSNGRQILDNPKTGMNILFYTLLIGGLCVCTYIVVRKKQHSLMVILLIGIIIIPSSVYALCKCELKVNSKVEIQQTNFTGVIYRNSQVELYPGDSIIPNEEWFIYNRYLDKTNEDDSFDTKEECEAFIDEIFNNDSGSGDRVEQKKYTTMAYRPSSREDFICQSKKTEAGEYVTKASDLNKNYYIRNEVKNDIVTKAQACFFTTKEVCLDPESQDFDNNSNLIQEQASWFEGKNGECRFDTENYYNGCMSDNLFAVTQKNGWPFNTAVGINPHERKYCTAFFCDLDPEKLSAVPREYIEGYGSGESGGTR